MKNAALSVLDFYEPATQWIGMVSLPYGQPWNKCIAYGDRRRRRRATAAAHLSGVSELRRLHLAGRRSQLDYKMADGTLNTSDTLVQQINCLARAQSYVYAKSDGQPPSGEHTNLGDPLDAAREMLATQGRADVPDVIIFMTDGQANQPSTRQPCTYFNNKATIAKNEGQTIFTIAYGLDVNPPVCAFGDAGFSNAYATTTSRPRPRSRRSTTFPAAAGRTRTRTATTTSAPRGRPTLSRCSARWRPPRSRPRT